jgi:ubiquinone/menaquinone biosynthesis C-methylase UbiE
MAETHRSYIPAAGHDWLLPLYDPFQRWLRGDAFLRALVDDADIRSKQRVLDMGCGTGALTILVQRSCPEAAVVGLDPDPKALEIAKRKSEEAGFSIHFDRGFADELPYAPASFDRVTCSFMFHHLTRDEKLDTLRDAHRVLRPGGSLHILDFGPPRSRYSSVVTRLLHRGQHLRDNVGGRIPSLMARSGLAESSEVAHRSTAFGTISYWRAIRPDTEQGRGAT